MTTTLETLRIPRGLWNDLQETVIQQDRQFLTEVARSLGLPIQDVLKRCLGSGVSTALQTLVGDDTESTCPWSVKTGGLWSPCTRLRQSPTSACYIHANAQRSDSVCLTEDPAMSAIPTAIPISFENRIYWWCPSDLEVPVYNEDGSPASGITFAYVDINGRPVCVCVSKDDAQE